MTKRDRLFSQLRSAAAALPGVTVHERKNAITFRVVKPKNRFCRIEVYQYRGGPYIEVSSVHHPEEFALLLVVVAVLARFNAANEEGTTPVTDADTLNPALADGSFSGVPQPAPGERARVVHVHDQVPGAVYIGRAAPRSGLRASFFQNLFRIEFGRTHLEAVELYRRAQTDVITPEFARQLRDLRGKPLACWCRHDGEARTDENACHGDVLVELLEKYSDAELQQMAGGG